MEEWAPHACTAGRVWQALLAEGLCQPELLCCWAHAVCHTWTGRGVRQCVWPLVQATARRHLVAGESCPVWVWPPRLTYMLPSLAGLSVPNVHGALAPLAIPSAAAAAAAGRIAIPGLAGAGNSVLLVSNLNPEVCGCGCVRPLRARRGGGERTDHASGWGADWMASRVLGVAGAVGTGVPPVPLSTAVGLRSFQPL